MGFNCVAYGCTNKTENLSTSSKNLRFFKFPLFNPLLLQKWLLQIRRNDFIPNSNSLICSDHFSDDCFEIQKSTGEKVLKKAACPTKFNFSSSIDGLRNEVEVKMKDPSKGFKAFIGQREKQCNQCGFATFSLPVLYKHRHKCRGKLLGPGITCAFCKRKFRFLSLFRTHKPACVKKAVKRKILREKLKEKHLGFKTLNTSFSCPICEASFETKEKFVNHLRTQNCQSPRKKRKSLSARKSLNSQRNLQSVFSEKHLYSAEPRLEKDIPSHDNELYNCKWCKSYYPTQKLLNMHMKTNEECSKAFNRSKSLKKTPLKARKSIGAVAKKSFSNKKARVKKSYSHRRHERSARKSFPSASRESSYESSENLSDSEMLLKECPVCFRCFTDVYSCFLHQKTMNHWGKATKSFHSVLKCPFCAKEFAHIFSRDAHLRNHADVPLHKIKAFFKNHTCSVCSTSFASVLAKIQHERISHSKKSSRLGKAGNSYGHAQPKMSSVSKSVKKKLKQQPNSCPVCCKVFSHTVLRNKHFNEAHLKIFECQVCSTKFKSLSSLESHMNLSHTDEFECKGCRIRFKDELNLLQHVLKSHHNKDPKLFLPAKLLAEDTPNYEKSTEVMAVDKEKDIPKRLQSFEFYCDICNIGYLKLCGLQRHRQSKLHKETIERKLDPANRSKPDAVSVPRKVILPEILLCSECSTEFTSIKDFVPHRLSHFSVQGKYLRITERNPYMCEICSEVLDSHSKVQLHLFWHLQIESTAVSGGNTSSIRKKTIVPDRLSGQHVAKKSFIRQDCDSSQEVTIGGVTKALFTCEVCNVSFVTKEHYTIHVQKRCRKGKFGVSSPKTASEIDNKPIVESNGLVQCFDCNFLFGSSNGLDEHKPHCSKVSSSGAYSLNLVTVKSALANKLAVAGCLTCGALFDSPVNTLHLAYHLGKKDDSHKDGVPEEILHCALCHCLFSLSSFKDHKNFCNVPLNLENPRNVKCIDSLKSSLELMSAVAACISCAEPFDNLDLCAKHLNLHKAGKLKNDSSIGSFSSSKVKKNIPVNQKSEADSCNNRLKRSHEMIEENSTKKQRISEDSSQPVDHDTDDSKQKSTNTEELCNNFSKLLCTLIADSELMETLGYGKLSIEEVLVNVLKQMGQNSCAEAGIPPVEKFKKNIKTLLDLCLKDEVMQDIGKDKTVEEIVIGALKIFEADAE